MPGHLLISSLDLFDLRISLIFIYLMDVMRRYRLEVLFLPDAELL